MITGNNFQYARQLSSGSSTLTSFMRDEQPKYWIYVVIHELYENLDSLQPFIMLLENFGASLGNRAEVIRPHRNTYATNRQTVLSLLWDEQTSKSLAQKMNPYLLVLSCDISEFKPSSTNYAIIDFQNPTIASDRHSAIVFRLTQEINTKNSIADWQYAQAAENMTDGVVSRVINANGGAVVTGDVSTTGGDFVGRDQIILVIHNHLDSSS